jgi:superfamily II DNA/RNA helicase
VGVTHLTPVQERTLRAVIVDERDVLVQAPTGSGKTLAYLLPIAHALAKNDALVKSGGGGVSYTPGSPSAIVFLPTRELAAQVFAHAEKHVTAAGYPTVLCVGGAPDAPQIAALKAGARVVIGTPGRIKEFVDRGVIKTDAVIVQVLDEADRLLDGGFEMDVEAVMRPPGGQCRTMCLSATMPAQLARFLQRRLPPDHAEVSLHGRGGSNVGGTLEHLAMSCHPNDVVATILAAVDAYAHGGGDGCGGAGVSETKNNLNLGAGDWKKTSVTGQAIVFVETKASAEQLSGTLTAAYEVRPVGFSGVFLSHLCFYPVSRVTFSGSFRWIGLDTFFSFLDRVPRVEGNKRNGATAMVDDYKNPSS